MRVKIMKNDIKDMKDDIKNMKNDIKNMKDEIKIITIWSGLLSGQSGASSLGVQQLPKLNSKFKFNIFYTVITRKLCNRKTTLRLKL